MRNPLDTHGFGAVLYKETRHIVRDRLTLFISLMIPVAQLLLFGYAINTKVEHVPSAVYNEDRGDRSIAFINALRGSKIFDVTIVAKSRSELQRLIISGTSRVAFNIPPNFTADFNARRPTRIQVLIDGSDSTIAQPAYADATAIGSAFTGTAPSVLDVRPRVLFNPEMRSANFLVPGLIGLIMQLITMFLTALSIVGERERGTLDQLMVTPIGALGLMLGKLTPYAVIGFLDFLLALFAMNVIFRVPIVGSLPLLLVLGTGFLAAALGLGLLVSTFARTQVQAMLGVLALTLPSILLSGFFFERSLMPPVMQWLGYVIPLTYFLEISRAVVLRGAGAQDIPGPIVAMLALVNVSSARCSRRQESARAASLRHRHEESAKRRRRSSPAAAR
jgi:ABC-type multidrug transport system permease subunit